MTRSTSLSSSIVDFELKAIEDSTCPGSMDGLLETSGNGYTYETSSGGGYVSFDDLDDSASAYAPGSLDSEVEIPIAGSESNMDSNSSGEIDDTTGASGISSNTDAGSSNSIIQFWSGSGSASSDTKSSGSGSTSTPREPSSSSSSTSSPVPPASTAPANEGSRYPVGAATAPTGIPQDNDASTDSSSDTSTTGNGGISLDPIQPIIQPSSGSTDNSNLSATSPVTSSHFSMQR